MSRLIMTSQRQVILDELMKSNSHLTADEIYGRVRRRMPKISLGTVYRNLKVLAKSGLIGKMELAGAQTRFDHNPVRHYHLRCIQCGRIEDALLEPLSSIESDMDGKSGYRILGHHLDFIGLCPACQHGP